MQDMIFRRSLFESGMMDTMQQLTGLRQWEQMDAPVHAWSIQGGVGHADRGGKIIKCFGQ